MPKLDVQKLFDALCDCVLHELSTKEIIRKYDDDNRIMSGLIHFVQDERKNRGLPAEDFAIQVDRSKLVYNWGKWNSGGGCMIWSVDILEHYSIHLSDESCILASCPSEKFWKLEWDSEDPNEDTQQTFQLAECDMCDLSQGRTPSSLFCPWLGQEVADAVERDIDVICELM